MKKQTGILAAILYVLCGCVTAAAAQEHGSQLHNARDAALEHLRQSEAAYIGKNWTLALNLADIGIAYDADIADLWYTKALCAKELHAPVSEILPLISRAVVSDGWVTDKKAQALVFYADMLSDTGNSRRALEVLQQASGMMSADMHYVRLKSLYRLNTPDSITLARQEAYDVCRLFPSDDRFARFFFQMELDTVGTDEFDAIAETAQIFAGRVDMNDAGTDAELAVYAMLFSPPNEQMVQMQQYSARGFRHYLYAPLALRAGLLSETQALDYVIDFFDQALPYDFFERFALMLEDDEAKDRLLSVMTAFSGQLTKDTDGDGLANLYVKYERGRPVQITYDANCDGLAEISADCDFGVPIVLTDNTAQVVVRYREFPEAASAEVLKLLEDTYLVYTFDGVPFTWSPFGIVSSEPIAASYDGFLFYFPELHETESEVLTESYLLSRATGIDTAVQELGKDIQIHFAVLDGQYAYAEYTADAAPYARAYFSDGVLDRRHVDTDGDGHFERREVYQASSRAAAEEPFFQNVFGSAPVPQGMYLAQVQLDMNLDTVPDYIQSFDEDGTVMASWDTDYDGAWNVRHAAYAGSDIEDIFYYRPHEQSAVRVRLRGGVPESLLDGTAEYPVVKDAQADVYWIGNTQAGEFADDVLSALSRIASEGVCTMVPAGNDRILAVRVGDFCFGEFIEAAEQTE